MSAPAFTIRAYLPDDYASVCSLWQEAGMNAFTEEGLARVHAMGGEVLVAERECPCGGSKVVGTVLWVHNGRQAFVWRLAVSPLCRRSGVARKLMEAVEWSTQAAGFPRMGLIVGRDNTAARALYENMGWTRSETLETWWKYPAKG